MGKEQAGNARISIRRGAVLLAVAFVSLGLVVFFGRYQFSRRAEGPIRLIKEHEIPGTGVTIGDGIEGFIRENGVKTTRVGFKPRWGAEEKEHNVFIVSFVYEVGREAHWISWKVTLPAGKVVPRDDWARRLWYGAPRR